MEKSNFENSYMMRLSADGVFTGSIFKHADLALSSMNGSDLSCSDMTGCKLINASFNNVNLESAKLVKANIKGTKFRYTNFAGADLTGLDLNMAEIFYSNLYGAKTDNKYIQLCLTGICNRITYCIEDNRVWEGDWTGSLNDFEKKIKNRSISTDENLTYLKIIHCLKVMKGSGDLIDHVKRISECIRLL